MQQVTDGPGFVPSFAEPAFGLLRALAKQMFRTFTNLEI